MIRRVLNAIKHRKRNPRSRLYRYTNWTLTVLGFGYVLLLFFPSSLFAHSARVGQFTFYSDRPIPAHIESVVEQATARLATSPLYADTDTFDVCIAADRWRRVLLIPRARGAFGAAMVWTGNTVLNRCDISKNTCLNDQPEFNRRPMHVVLAHECTHHLMADHLGMIAYLRLPEWKNEGYCEYVADSPSFDISEGEALIRNGKSHKSHAFRYLRYFVAVRSCIEENGLEPRQFFTAPLDFEKSLDAVRQARGDNKTVNPIGGSGGF